MSRTSSTVSNVRRRLLRKRVVDYKRGCWLWSGAVMKNGYGVIGVCVKGKKSNRLVHRTSAWAFAGFDLLSPMQILHSCDVRHCFNPAHLLIGTQLDNIRDAWNKGHLNNVMQRHPRKLVAVDVLKIRKSYLAGGCTTRSLAAEYSIGKSTVEAILNRRIWRHV